MCGKYPCECEIEITLNSSGSITLGNSFTLRASVTPAGIEMDSYQFFVGNNSLGIGNSKTLSVMAGAPGRHSFKVVGIKDDKEYTSDTKEVQVNFPSASSIAHDSTVKLHITAAWNKTLSAADASGVQEFGAAVYVSTVGGICTYQCTPITGTRVSYDERPYIEFNMLPDNPSGNFQSGGTWGVGMFHTHVPLWHYPGVVPIRRVVGPSDGDIGTIYPGFVIDFIGTNGYHYSSDPPSSPKTNYYYGPGARAN